ncbi:MULTISPECIES: hypothetical protein [Enterobacteriaceae]|uniref:hypothetical protein n=1 Tax=Enterobacteriaceae TaxID=543 RepID=UPI0039784E77
MADSNNNKALPVNKTDNQTPIEAKKKCFIMMPIAEHKDYPPGHFQRVYDYLIKPACEIAGMEAYRADDNKASDMIMLDILQQLVECDMAICDISSRNANVFFELGLRQAFNKKTILITDGLQSAPFDISGLRHVSYSHSLRVDTVAKEVPEIADMLIKTDKLPDNKVNSIVQLLQIKPAKVETKELSTIDTVVFDMFSQLKEQINNMTLDASNRRLSSTTRNKAYSSDLANRTLLVGSGVSFFEIYDDNDPQAFINEWEIKKKTENDRMYILKRLGKFLGIDNGKLAFQLNDVIQYFDDTLANRKRIVAV